MVDRPYTDAQVDTVAAWFAHWFGTAPIRPRDRAYAREVLDALTVAGQLPPTDAVVQWGWLSSDGERIYPAPTEQAARRAGSRSGADQTMRRWVTAWQPAPDESEARDDTG